MVFEISEIIQNFDYRLFQGMHWHEHKTDTLTSIQSTHKIRYFFSFKSVAIFAEIKTKSAKMTTLLKEISIAQQSSKNERTLRD